MFRKGDVHKTYWAITRNMPAKKSDLLTHYLKPVERNNKTYLSEASDPKAKEARLRYSVVASTERYHLLEITLLTGRKHQIRAQLSAIGCPIKGDLKYGDKRSNPDGSISLMARKISFVHPVSGNLVEVSAPVPDDTLWKALENDYTQNQLSVNE